MATMEFKDYMTSSEAAEILGVTRARISMLCKTGKLEYAKMGKFNFPSRASVEAYKDNPAREKHAPKPKAPGLQSRLTGRRRR